MENEALRILRRRADVIEFARARFRDGACELADEMQRRDLLGILPSSESVVRDAERLGELVRAVFDKPTKRLELLGLLAARVGEPRDVANIGLLAFEIGKLGSEHCETIAKEHAERAPARFAIALTPDLQGMILDAGIGEDKVREAREHLDRAVESAASEPAEDDDAAKAAAAALGLQTALAQLIGTGFPEIAVGVLSAARGASPATTARRVGGYFARLVMLGLLAKRPDSGVILSALEPSRAAELI